jgi:hypothetical protein
MSKKTSIISVFTMIFAIVALLAATQVFAESKVTQNGSCLILESDGITARTVCYEIDLTTNNFEKLKVNGAHWEVDPALRERTGIRDYKRDFRFCIRCLEDTPPADCVTIGTEKFKCYVPKWVSNEAAFISNPSCPIFLNPPGIFIDPCK